jgi:DNA-binding transcriptional ArsR family regulator
MTEDGNPNDIAVDALDQLHDDPEARVDDLQAYRPDDSVVTQQKTVFTALANETRLQILAVLDDGECNVYELQACLELPQSTVANHLRQLREVGLVKSRKKGKWTYYRIADVAVFELLELAELIHE